MTDAEAVEIWQRARTVPTYVKVLVGDTGRLKAALYAARAKHAPELSGIECRTSPLSPRDTLWLGPKGFLEHSLPCPGR